MYRRKSFMWRRVRRAFGVAALVAFFVPLAIGVAKKWREAVQEMAGETRLAQSRLPREMVKHRPQPFYAIAPPSLRAPSSPRNPATDSTLRMAQWDSSTKSSSSSHGLESSVY